MDSQNYMLQMVKTTLMLLHNMCYIVLHMTCL
jgi:hypothetical protein